MLALINTIFWQVVLWTLFCAVAVNMFIRIRMYCDDPRRAELDNEWFEAFEAYQVSRYQAGGLHWRVRDLSVHWGGDSSDNDSGSG